MGGLSFLPVAPFRPSSADKVKGKTATKETEPTGVTRPDARRRMIPGMKARMLIARSERVELLDEIFSNLSMMCCF